MRKSSSIKLKLIQFLICVNCSFKFPTIPIPTDACQAFFSAFSLYFIALSVALDICMISFAFAGFWVLSFD